MVGMSVDCVKMGRIPKAEKERAIMMISEEDKCELEANETMPNQYEIEILKSKMNEANFLNINQIKDIQKSNPLMMNGFKLVMDSIFNYYSTYFKETESVEKKNNIFDKISIKRNYKIITDTRFMEKDSNNNLIGGDNTLTDFLIKSCNRIFSEQRDIINKIFLKATFESEIFHNNDENDALGSDELKSKAVNAFKKCMGKIILNVKKIIGFDEIKNEDFITILKSHAFGIFMVKNLCKHIALKCHLIYLILN